MKGNFLGAPTLNVPAFWSASRISPADFKNLARTYPGRPDGTISERIAYYSLEKIIANATIFIDLHSGGRNTFLPLLCGYYNDHGDLGRISREAAISFGAPVVWEHEVLSPGRTIYEAVRSGIPALYTECRGGGHLDEHDTQHFKQGLRNLLKYLQIIPGTPDSSESPRLLGGEGDVDVAIGVNQGGFFRSRVKLLERVEKGQRLGEVTDLVGEVIEEIRADNAGLIELVRATPRVFPGETVFLISPELKQA
jgi:predicted deacylase